MNIGNGGPLAWTARWCFADVLQMLCMGQAGQDTHHADKDEAKCEEADCNDGNRRHSSCKPGDKGRKRGENANREIGSW